MFFEKGRRNENDLGVPDIITAKRGYNGYPTEKPPAVASVLIEQSTLAGEIVIDPFMGSGSTGVAAVGVGRHLAGNDLCAEAVAVSRRRLLAAGGQEVLPRTSEAQARLAFSK